MILRVKRTNIGERKVNLNDYKKEQRMSRNINYFGGILNNVLKILVNRNYIWIFLIIEPKKMLFNRSMFELFQQMNKKENANEQKVCLNNFKNKHKKYGWT